MTIKNQELQNLTKKQIINLLIEAEEKREKYDADQLAFIHNKDLQINKLEAIVGAGLSDALSHEEIKHEVVGLRAVVSHLNGLLKYAIRLNNNE